MAHPLFGWAGFDVVGKSSLVSWPRIFKEVVDWLLLETSPVDHPAGSWFMM